MLHELGELNYRKTFNMHVVAICMYMQLHALSTTVLNDY